MHPQGKYNALLPPPPFSSFSLFLTFSLLSPFSSATKGGFVARRSSTKPYTLSTTVLSITSHHHRHRRLAELSECYKRVRERAIRQRCNTVLRTPLSSRRISYFVDFVSSIRSKSEKKIQGEPVCCFTLSFHSQFSVINVQSFSSRIISRSFIINLSSNLIR